MSLSRSTRIGIIAVLFACAVTLCVATALGWLRTSPPVVDFTAGHQAGQPVNLTVQTVGAIGVGPHPTWVSYLVESPQGQWVHTTLWQLPAHTQVNVTIDQYDTGSPIRNPENGKVFGDIGNVATYNGKSTGLINSYASNADGGLGLGHTFSVPTLGINVPLLGVINPNAASFCGNGPCTLANEHNVITFSFMTPGPGEYPWQCFVPCGAGFLYGNGGPMSTVGYMGGFLEVVS